MRQEQMGRTTCATCGSITDPQPKDEEPKAPHKLSEADGRWLDGCGFNNEWFDPLGILNQRKDGEE